MYKALILLNTTTYRNIAYIYNYQYFTLFSRSARGLFAVPSKYEHAHFRNSMPMSDQTET